jgi:hypothetical protein
VLLGSARPGFAPGTGLQRWAPSWAALSLRNAHAPQPAPRRPIHERLGELVRRRDQRMAEIRLCLERERELRGESFAPKINPRSAALADRARGEGRRPRSPGSAAAAGGAPRAPSPAPSAPAGRGAAGGEWGRRSRSQSPPPGMRRSRWVDECRSGVAAAAAAVLLKRLAPITHAATAAGLSCAWLLTLANAALPRARAPGMPPQERGAAMRGGGRGGGEVHLLPGHQPGQRAAAGAQPGDPRQLSRAAGGAPPRRGALCRIAPGAVAV